MADSEDLKRLESGELDLSRCDFREANLSDMDLSGRDFTHCLFEKAQCEGTLFDRSDFRGAKVSFVKAKNATFDECILENAHFGYTDLSGASFINVAATGAGFLHAILNGANLKGAQFRGGRMDADTELNDVIADESSDFEGLKVLRSTSRNPLFKDYTFKDGTLHRKAVVENSEGKSLEWTSEGKPLEWTSEGKPLKWSLGSRDEPVKEQSSEISHSTEGLKIVTAQVQIRHLLQNAVVTRLTAQQFASQIEGALREVPTTDGNQIAEPLQTMLEFAEVLRNLAPETQPASDPLDRSQMEFRIAQLEALVERLTNELADENKLRKAAEELAASDGFKANFVRSAGKASGTAAVALATSIVTIGVPTATVYFLGAEHPIVNSFLTVIGRLPT